MIVEGILSIRWNDHPFIINQRLRNCYISTEYAEPTGASLQELKDLLGHVPLPVREVYLEEDPPRMFSAMRATSKPCLAFKILAAGRVCDRQESVEQAFESTFRQIKPNDAVIVGMYPEYEDQAAINADYVRRFSGLSGQG